MRLRATTEKLDFTVQLRFEVDRLVRLPVPPSSVERRASSSARLCASLSLTFDARAAKVAIRCRAAGAARSSLRGREAEGSQHPCDDARLVGASASTAARPRWTGERATAAR